MRAEAPLFRDPIYDAPTDPVIIWNLKEKCWWMLYTQRRSAANTPGVAHIHGTAIGVATSQDGSGWLYRGTLSNLEFEKGHNTFWAPEVIYELGKYHMFVTYVRGIPTDWNRERHIVHYTSDDLWDWKFESILLLSSDKVIDACVYKVDKNTYKMWYKDERHDSHTYTAVSNDLYHWIPGGAEITDCSHEGPNVFELSGQKWMITDEWNGLGVYKTDNFCDWERQGVILRDAGKRPMDGGMADHADVVVCGDRAYIFYFLHPFFENEKRRSKDYIPGPDQFRTCIQVAELTVESGKLCCDRDADFSFELRYAID